MTARWALYRLLVYRTLRVLSILKAVSPRVPIWLCPGPGVRGELYHMRPEAHAPRHRRLQRSPHITKASAIDPLDLWRVLGHAGALSTRALRSLTPATVDAPRARVRWGHLRCGRLCCRCLRCLCCRCPVPVASVCAACSHRLPPKSMLRRRAPQTTASRVPARCRSAGMPHAPCGAARARAGLPLFGGQRGAEWPENQSRVMYFFYP